MPKADKAVTPAPVRERYIVGDTTSESLQEAFRATERGLLGLYDELSGFFGHLERYGSSGHAASERSFMLQTYNGGPYTVDRISRGSFYIPNLSLTVLGGIQPDLIRKQSHAATDDGLIQRLTPIMLRPGWPPRVDANANLAITDYETLIPQLLALAPPEAGNLRFDEGAQAIRDDLAEEHDALVKECEGFNAKLSTALGKADGLFARLCVIWHCVEHAGKPGCLPAIVTEETAARVASFMVEFIQAASVRLLCRRDRTARRARTAPVDRRLYPDQETQQHRQLAAAGGGALDAQTLIERYYAGARAPRSIRLAYSRIVGARRRATCLDGQSARARRAVRKAARRGDKAAREGGRTVEKSRGGPSPRPRVTLTTLIACL